MDPPPSPPLSSGTRSPGQVGGHGIVPIRRYRLSTLLLPLVLLIIITALALFLHSSTEIYMLLSQCHARSRIPLPLLARIPLLGTASCSVVSFWGEALGGFDVAASTPQITRSTGIMAAILSFLAALVTTTTLESARVLNSPSPLLTNPTPVWLLFNLLGGSAFVFQAVTIPSFLRRSRAIISQRRRGIPAGQLPGHDDPTFGFAMRHLSQRAEVVAIPLAVAVGFVLPAALMLFLHTPLLVAVWVFSPLWVSLIRRAARATILLITARTDTTDMSVTHHFESDALAKTGIYAVPMLISFLSHGLLIYSFAALREDRREMTKATIQFLEVNVFFVLLTVAYWLAVEAGWRTAVVMAAASVSLGPGAGVCVAWMHREGRVDLDRSVQVIAVGSRRVSQDDDALSEETPLLRGRWLGR